MQTPTDAQILADPNARLMYQGQIASGKTAGEAMAFTRRCFDDELPDPFAPASEGKHEDQ